MFKKFLSFCLIAVIALSSMPIIGSVQKVSAYSQEELSVLNSIVYPFKSGKWGIIAGYNYGVTHGGAGYEADLYALDLTLINSQGSYDGNATKGYPVYAAISGYVESGWTSGGYGTGFRIWAKSGLKSASNNVAVGYEHLDNIQYSTGSYVNQGDLVGYTTSSNMSTTNHLHIAARRTTTPYNQEPIPLKYGSFNFPEGVDTSTTAPNGTYGSYYTPVYYFDVISKNPTDFYHTTSPQANFSNATGYNTASHIRKLADVNGDGKDDIVAFAETGVHVALANGNGFNASSGWTSNFAIQSTNKVWNTTTNHRTLGDLNGDKKADIVGFADDGMYYALSNGVSGFGPMIKVGDFFGTNQGWSTANNFREIGSIYGKPALITIGQSTISAYEIKFVNGTMADPRSSQYNFGFVKCMTSGPGDGWNNTNYTRVLTNFNGNGLSDIIGFGENGVSVCSWNSTTGTYSTPRLLNTNFGNSGSSGGWNNTNHLRTAKDIDGDGDADIIGFGVSAVYTSINNGGNLQPALGTWFNDFVSDKGWDNVNRARAVGDIDGDKIADIVAFGQDKTYFVRGTGKSFANIKWSDSFGAKDTTTGCSLTNNICNFADVDADKDDDLILFGQQGVMVSINDGTKFGPPTLWYSGMKAASGWTKEYVRTVGDINGDGAFDLIGFGHNDTSIALANKDSSGKYVRFGDGTNRTYAVPAFHNTEVDTETGKVGWNTSNHHRTVGDVDGDGDADIIGFWNKGIYVSKINVNASKQITSVSAKTKWSGDFVTDNGGWNSTKYLRLVGDIDNNKCIDIVAFGEHATYASKSNCLNGFNSNYELTDNYDSSSGWNINDHVRMLYDVDNDGKSDLVIFGNDQATVGISNGNTFNSEKFLHYDYGKNDKWNNSRHVRTMANLSTYTVPNSSTVLKFPSLIGVHEDGVYTGVLLKQ